MKAFRKIKVYDRELDQVQSNIGNIIGPILKSPLIDGVQINGVVLSTSPTSVQHLLKRVPQGWFIVDSNAAATVYRTDWDLNKVILIASAPVTVSIWIY